MKILNFGSLNIDLVYRVPHFVRPGETIASMTFSRYPGGKGLNQSVACAKAGAQTYHAGTIGPDGAFLRDLLQEAGAHIDHLRMLETSVTGNALIQVNDEGENCIILFGGSNQENDPAWMKEVIATFEPGDILVLQNEINDLPELIRLGREQGMQIMLNPSPMDADLAAMDLTGVTWLMLNETEGKELAGEEASENDSIQALADRILNILCTRYPGLQIVLTLGGDGSVWACGEERIAQAIFPADVVDTTAAGDTFSGYFAASMAEGKSVEEALRRASMAASIAISRPGAAVSVPMREEVDNALN